MPASASHNLLLLCLLLRLLRLLLLVHVTFTHAVQATPEYQKINKSMTVEEFKSIYFWEWFHRMWGRSLGVLFAFPAMYFVARRDTRAVIVKGGYVPRLIMLFTLGGVQGLIGWWMVKSGLEHTHVLGFDRPESDMPRV